MPLNSTKSALFLVASLLFGVSTQIVFVGADENPAAKPLVAPAPASAAIEKMPFSEDSAWKPSHFGGDGDIEMNDGVLSLGFGDPLTGVRWEGDFPKDNYEISFEGRRTGGFDFFCGLTLPVADQRVSLILGGWGGSLVGLSSINGDDASNNETMLIRNFEKDTWYKIRVAVTTEKIKVWIDEDDIIDLERAGRQFDIRVEMEESTPVGIAAYQCESEIRNFQVQKLR